MNAPSLPDPPIGPEVDCTDLDSFMLNTERLLGSELVAVSSHSIIGAAVLLWCRAWKQRPAASLPDDERVLAGFASMPLARFRKVRDKVLHGFVKCSDGRLYHPVLAAEAAVAYHKKNKFRTQLESEKKKKMAMRAAKKARKAAIPGESVPRDVRSYTGTVIETGTEEESLKHPPDSEIRAGARKRAVGGGEFFAFQGAIIRVSQSEYDRWKASYPAIRDLTAELQAIDDKLNDEGGADRKWFGRVGGWLRTINATYAEQRTAGGTRGYARAAANGAVAAGLAYQPESPQHWRDRLRVWFDRQQGAPDPDAWPDAWGPPLGDRDCRVPPEVLAEFRPKEG